MENRYVLNCDIKTKITTVILFKQGDTDSSVLEMILTNNKIPEPLTGEAIEFRFLKSDGTIVYQDINTGVTILDDLNGKVECVLKSDTLAKAGIVKVEINRVVGSESLTTLAFSFTVEASIGDSGLLSGNYISAIESKIVDWQTQMNGLLAGGATSVTPSSINGNIKVDNVEQKVYDDTSVTASLAQKANQTQFIGVKKVTGKPNPYVLLVNDYFNDNSNWSAIQADASASTAWTTSGNKITSPTGQSNDSLNVFKNLKLQDGIVEVVYENPDPSGTQWCGIMIKNDSVGNKRLCVLLFEAGGSANVAVWAFNGTSYTPITGAKGFLNEVDTMPTLNQPITLSMEIIGGEIKIYVNGRTMVTTRDPSILNYINGTMECGLIASKAKAYQFSNFKIIQHKFDIINPNINKILCSGSSITNGYNVTRAWRDRWGNNIDTLFDNTVPVTIINGGGNGNTSTIMLNQLPAFISASLPIDICTIEGSVNDCKNTEFTNYTSIINNLRALIKLCKQDNIIPILMTATPVSSTISNLPDWDSTVFPRICQMNIRIKQLAYDENIRLIDNAYAFGNVSSYVNKMALLQADGIHPNDTGAQLIADTALKVITQ